MRPKVINIKYAPRGWENDPQYVYIGRPRRNPVPKMAHYFGNDGSVTTMVIAGEYGSLGNPIPVGPTPKGEPCVWCGRTYHVRGGTLLCYEHYLTWRLSADPKFYQQVKELAGKTLVCFCKPFPCHGDILAQVCEELNK